MSKRPSAKRVFFGDFEMDLRAGELRRQGQKIRLRGIPFRLLEILLEHPGEFVSREDLRQRLWPNGTFVDFDHGLNVAMANLRHALSDCPANPKFIETVVGRGYRFVAAVERDREAPQVRPPSLQKGGKGKIRIAVLPFEDLSAVPEQMHFCDGLSSEIIARLGHLYGEELGVIARTSTLKYRSNTKSIARIGRELSVDYILEGTVRTIADEVHITAQLIRASDQESLWANRYTYRLGDAIAVQSGAADTVSRCVGRELLSQRATPLPGRVTAHQDAYFEYLKGEFHQAKRTGEGCRKSIRHFENAIRIDPNYALAYSGLANSTALLAIAYGGAWPPGNVFPQAMQAAMRALEINANLAECQTSLALIKYTYEWDWNAVERLLGRAIELNPSYAFAHQIFGYYLSTRGRHQKAVQESELACEFDPLSPSVNVAVGQAYYLARQYDKAIAALRSTLDLDPAAVPASMWLAACYAQTAMFPDAIATLESAGGFESEDAMILGCLGGVYAAAGRTEAARNVLDKLILLSKQRYISPFDFALVQAGLGEKENALDHLQKAYLERSPRLAAYVKTEPRFDPLRSDERFLHLLKRMGLESD